MVKIDYLLQITSQIVNQDAGFIKQNIPIIIKQTEFLLDSVETWKLKKSLYGTALCAMMRALTFQIEQYSQYNKIFPQWTSFKNRFMRITKIILTPGQNYFQSSLQKSERKQRNKLLKQYQNKYQLIRPITMTKDGPKQIVDVISEKFPKSIGWWQIFSALNRNCRIGDQQRYFIENVHDQRPMPLDYFCCSEFVYQDLNCYNPHIDCYNQIQYISSSQKDCQIEIREKVLSMLNSNGGLLIFDTHTFGTQLVVQGVSLNEQDKEQTQSRIASLFLSFSPQITINIHYKFRWIPVIQSPKKYFSQNKQKSKQYRTRKFKKGQFLLTMLITPANPQITYHYTINNENFILKRDSENRKKQLQANDSYQFIKQRFYKNYFKKPFQHSHDMCQMKDVLRGYFLYGNDINHNVTTEITAQETQFKFHSLVVVDRTNKHKVQEVLRQQKIEYLIQQAFSEYKFRLSSTTWLLHHNLKFDRVKMVINKNNLRYANNSKSVILIATTSYLQTSYIQQNSLNNLTVWIQGIYQEQSIKYQQKQFEYFIQTQTVMGSIFLYMLLDHFHIRARFKKNMSSQNIIPQLIV